MGKSNFTKTIASIALIGNFATAGCSNQTNDPEQLADAKKRLNEADISLTQAKAERAKSERRLDNLYKQVTPEEANEALQKAHAQIIRSQTADAIDQALAKEDLEKAIHMCQLSREGFKERRGSYPSPDLNCQ